ncbi:MAG: hypothetical protein ABIW94_11280 [Gemmatimonadaceae bacterium]
MSIGNVSDLTGRLFRIGSAYDLVVFDRLPLEEQAALAELHEDPDLYGVLKPREGTARTYRAIGRETALLLLTLREPGPLPFFVWSGDATAAAEAISDLVLDGVLEIEEAGQFISGPAATVLVSGAQEESGQGQLRELSRQAMIYGQALELDDPVSLASRLYAFGRCPVSADLARLLSDNESTLAWLGAPKGSDLRQMLESDWRLSPESEAPGWFAWSRVGRQRRHGTGTSFKLYVSPCVADVPTTFAIVVDCLGRRTGAQFKIGKGAEGIVRPDKIVAYFDTLESLLDAANDMSARLTGVRAQGVPFSAEISCDGLLSWGMDPPRDNRALSWLGPESWRLWIVRRLANAIVLAQRSEQLRVQPWQFAVERLSSEGVDTDRWIPTGAGWSAA